MREFRRMPIFVGESKFFLCQKLPGQGPFAMRYVLERWPADELIDTASSAFSYDEEFVRERDAEHGRNARADQIGRLLLFVYPLLGFLWSGTKKKLIPFGLVPRSITAASLFAGLCLLILQGTFIRLRLGFLTILFGQMQRLELGLLAADYALLGLMLVDLVLRFDQHLKDKEHPWGFGEWMMQPFRKPAGEEES